MKLLKALKVAENANKMQEAIIDHSAMLIIKWKVTYHMPKSNLNNNDTPLWAGRKRYGTKF